MARRKPRGMTVPFGERESEWLRIARERLVRRLRREDEQVMRWARTRTKRAALEVR
jgi:hypothetical protein